MDPHMASVLSTPPSLESAPSLEQRFQEVLRTATTANTPQSYASAPSIHRQSHGKAGNFLRRHWMKIVGILIVALAFVIILYSFVKRRKKKKESSSSSNFPGPFSNSNSISRQPYGFQEYRVGSPSSPSSGTFGQPYRYSDAPPPLRYGPDRAPRYAPQPTKLKPIPPTPQRKVRFAPQPQHQPQSQPQPRNGHNVRQQGSYPDPRGSISPMPARESSRPQIANPAAIPPPDVSAGGDDPNFTPI